MEDTGTMQSLTNLAKAGRVDLRRVMVLRTASNYDSQPPGLTAAENLAEENAGLVFRVHSQPGGGLPGGQRGRPRTHRHWDKYETTVPGG